MSTTIKNTGAIGVGALATQPTDNEPGTIYFDTGLNQLRFRNNSSYTAVLGAVADDLTPKLGGPLDVDIYPITSLLDIKLQATTTVKRSKLATPTDFIEEEYIHNSALMANQTNAIITGFSFDFLMFEGCKIDYKLKDSASNVRMGTMLIATNGTVTNLTDDSSDTGVDNVTFNSMFVGDSATAVIQSLTYTAVVPNSSGNAISIEYVNDGTAGSETASVIGNAITVHIQSGVSTANQIITAVQASVPASALVTVFLSGLNVAQVTTPQTFLIGGTDEQVALVYTSGAETAVLRADVKRIKA